jgi:outer membrane receptor for Fe3+-dicitrate
MTGTFFRGDPQMMFQRNRLAAAGKLPARDRRDRRRSPPHPRRRPISVSTSPARTSSGSKAKARCPSKSGAEDIKRTGATTVSELLRYIPSVDIFDQGEFTANSPSGSGTSNIKLRGLAETNVLVLLNGRRLPVNGLYDATGAGAAVDVNMIPLSAIERVEILKDGGSAIYGADAVSGVFNIITRTDYQGVEASVSYGNSSRNDGTEKRLQTLRRDSEITRRTATTYCSRWNISSASQSTAKTATSPKPSTDGALASATGEACSRLKATVDPNTGSFSGTPATLSSRPLQRVLSLRFQCKHPDTGKRR